MTLNTVMFALAVWTSVSVVAGLGLGAILRHCSDADGAMQMTPEPAFRKSA
jgi:hypothetical protein